MMVRIIEIDHIDHPHPGLKKRNMIVRDHALDSHRQRYLVAQARPPSPTRVDNLGRLLKPSNSSFLIRRSLSPIMSHSTPKIGR